jgi:hypothetical protein
MNHLALFVVTVAAAPALAQPAPHAEPVNTVGVDAIVVLPVGDYGDLAQLGAGALGRLEVPLGRGFATGRTGVIFHAMSSRLGNASLTIVPIYAGYRHPLGDGGGYVAAELGISIGFATVETGFGRASDSDTELGLTLSAGLRRGRLDVRGGLFVPDADDALGLMASVGYDFASF